MAPPPSEPGFRARRPLAERLLLVLACVPPVVMAAYVYAFGVDVPWWDQWRFSELIAAAQDGTLRWNDLWSSNNEHRFFVPNIVFALLGVATGWNIRAELAFSWAVLGVVTLIGLARCLPREGGVVRGTALVAISVWHFSFHAWENWLWGIQVSFAIHTAAVVWCLVLLTRERRSAWHVAGAILLAATASFSYSSGFIAWPVGLALLVFDRAATRRGRLVRSAIWALAAAAAAAAHFVDAFRPPMRPYAWSDAADIVLALLTMLGVPVTGQLGPPESAKAWGLAGIVLFAFLAGCTLGRRRAGDPALRALLGLGAFSLTATVLIAAVRSIQFGLGGVMIPRYAAICGMTWIAATGLAATLARGSGRSARAALLMLILLPLAAVLHRQDAGWTMGAHFAAQNRSLREVVRSGQGLSGEGMLGLNASGWWLFLGRWFDLMKSHRLSLFRDASDAERRLSSEVPSHLRLAIHPEGLASTGEVTVVLDGGEPRNMWIVVLSAIGSRPASQPVGSGVFDENGHGSCQVSLPPEAREQGFAVRPLAFGWGARLVTEPAASWKP